MIQSLKIFIKNLTPLNISFIGTFVLLAQFIFNRTFYIDEAALGLNIANRSFLQLTDFLDHNQSAPILFLWISKIVYEIYPSDFSLRIVPTFCSIMSFALLVKIVFSYFDEFAKSNLIKISFLFTILCSTVFLRYATEFKQYSLELFITLIFLLQLLKSEYIKAILLLIISIPLVHITPILFLTYLTIILFDIKQVYNYLPRLIFLTITFIILLFLYLSFFFFDNPTKDYMLEFWNYSFPVKNIFSMDFIIWFFQRILVINYTIFFYNFFHLSYVKYLFMFLPLFIFLFQGLGLRHLLKYKHHKMLILLLSPILFHFIFSYFKLYPFDTRLLFYLLPNIILIFIIGACSFDNKLIFGLFTLLFFVSLVLNFPFKQEEVKPLLKYLSKSLKENEVLYVFEDINNVIRFYNKDGPSRIKIDDDQIIFGNYLINKNDHLQKDLNKLNGLKGYLIFSNVNNIESRKSPLDFSSAILLGNQYLNTDETEFIKKLGKDNVKLLISTKEANLYKFDLSL